MVTALGHSARSARLPDVDPIDIPQLKQEAAQSSDDTDLQVQLRIARFKDAEYEAPRVSLEGAVNGGNQSGPAFLYLGMAHFRTGPPPGKRTRGWLAGGASAPAREKRSGSVLP